MPLSACLSLRKGIAVIRFLFFSLHGSLKQGSLPARIIIFLVVLPIFVLVGGSSSFSSSSCSQHHHISPAFKFPRATERPFWQCGRRREERERKSIQEGHTNLFQLERDGNGRLGWHCSTNGYGPVVNGRVSRGTDTRSSGSKSVGLGCSWVLVGEKEKKRFFYKSHVVVLAEDIRNGGS